MDGTQWECNSSDTLLNDFFSQDDLKQLAVDAGIMLECPLLVLDDTFHVDGSAPTLTNTIIATTV